MTMEATDDAAGTEDAEPKEHSYTIYPESFEARGQSIVLVVGDRLCEAARAKMRPPEPGVRAMTYKEIRKLAKDNCAGQEGYLSPQQPVLEAVFRLLLSAPKDQLSLSDIHEQLTDLWLTSPWPRHITLEALQRVLDNAISHGIAVVDAD